MNITHMSRGYMYNYTDGSATNVVQDGGSSIQGGQTTMYSTATGKHCTNYSAEVRCTRARIKSCR